MGNSDRAKPVTANNPPTESVGKTATGTQSKWATEKRNPSPVPFPPPGSQRPTFRFTLNQQTRN